MQYSHLPNTQEKISRIALGTMMYGDQVDQEEAFAQMEFSLANGINFWDTAQMYTIPPKAETFGNTEKIIGNFFQKNPEARKKIFLASKFSSRGIRKMDWIYNGNHFANKEHITYALEESLKKLQTDHIDLYQIHWPDRSANIFGKRNFQMIPQHEEGGTAIKETAQVLKDLTKTGKIRYIGISNESPWGTMKWIEISRKINLPLVSIQNPYNLINRLFEIGHSEICLRENLGLLAYSPLAMGVLSGKYQNGQIPKNSRRDLFPGYANRFWAGQTEKAITQYQHVADKHNLKLSQMALAFLLHQPFLTSAIVGATAVSQLQENIGTLDIKITPEILEDIDQVYQKFPDPCA